jgi:hypothetical protein
VVIPYVVYTLVSTTSGFFTSGKLSSLPSALLRAHGIVGSISVALASQTSGADPPSTLTATSRFVADARLAVERIMATRANDLYRSFQNLKVLGGCDAPHGLSCHHHAILETLFATVHVQ